MRWIATLFVVTVGAGAARADVPAPKLTAAADVVACVQPLGAHDPWLAGVIARGVAQLYGFTTKVLEARALPKAAYYKPRKRWRSTKLLNWMQAQVVPESGCRVVVGYTDLDISTTKGKVFDWGVLGEAFLDSKVAMISSFRTRKGVSKTVMAQRTVKTALHELGHTFGIEHHPGGPTCIVNDAMGKVSTSDDERGTLCESEWTRVEQVLGVAIPHLEAVDWDPILASTP